MIITDDICCHTSACVFSFCLSRNFHECSKFCSCLGRLGCLGAQDLGREPSRCRETFPFLCPGSPPASIPALPKGIKTGFSQKMEAARLDNLHHYT